MLRMTAWGLLLVWPVLPALIALWAHGVGGPARRF